MPVRHQHCETEKETKYVFSRKKIFSKCRFIIHQNTSEGTSDPTICLLKVSDIHPSAISKRAFLHFLVHSFLHRPSGMFVTKQSHGEGLCNVLTAPLQALCWSRWAHKLWSNSRTVWVNKLLHSSAPSPFIGMPFYLTVSESNGLDKV